MLTLCILFHLFITRHILLYLILVCAPMSAQRGGEGQSQCLSLLLSTRFFETGSLSPVLTD